MAASATPMVRGLVPVLIAVIAAVAAQADTVPCDVRACVESGCACGRQRWAEGGAIYASFLALPYARQPLGERRFKELEPPEPWEHLRDATREGPACHQQDVIYGRLMQPKGFSEACIHANVYVPLDANGARRRRLAPPRAAARVPAQLPLARGLPVLVMVHGGGFQSGSGDPDLHGPEYLVTKNVVVITFNYRLNALGFLSLNAAEVPGNQGLRDQVTLLRWVRRNARAFGGDPDNVTLVGQSAGAASVHLLTLSKAAEGLYKRAILMSGTAISGFFSTSPILARQLSGIFLNIVGLNATAAPADIHRQLVEMPIDKINEANKVILNQFGLTTFLPTVESEFPGVTRILDEDPELLVAQGRGQSVPLMIGFTDLECEVFRHRLQQLDIASKINDNPAVGIPSNIIFTTPPESLPDIAKKIDRQYYNGAADTNKFIQFCTDAFYKYPALKLAQSRAASGGAPVFLYRFSYDADYSPIEDALDLSYNGSAHIEDLTYVFRVNSLLGTHKSFPPKERDDCMKDWMTTFVTNFMQCSEPVCEDSSPWPSVRRSRLQLQDIQEPAAYQHRDLTPEEFNILQFFNTLRQK